MSKPTQLNPEASGFDCVGFFLSHQSLVSRRGARRRSRNL